jgi:hypothetical protein
MQALEILSRHRIGLFDVGACSIDFSFKENPHTIQQSAEVFSNRTVAALRTNYQIAIKPSLKLARSALRKRIHRWPPRQRNCHKKSFQFRRFAYAPNANIAFINALLRYRFRIWLLNSVQLIVELEWRQD